jgi:hypothetical protein
MYHGIWFRPRRIFTRKLEKERPSATRNIARPLAFESPPGIQLSKFPTALFVHRNDSLAVTILAFAVITVKEAKTAETDLEVVEGMEMSSSESGMSIAIRSIGASAQCAAAPINEVASGWLSNDLDSAISSASAMLKKR